MNVRFFILCLQQHTDTEQLHMCVAKSGTIGLSHDWRVSLPLGMSQNRMG